MCMCMHMHMHNMHMHMYMCMCMRMHMHMYEYIAIRAAEGVGDECTATGCEAGRAWQRKKKGREKMFHATTLNCVALSLAHVAMTGGLGLHNTCENAGRWVARAHRTTDSGTVLHALICGVRGCGKAGSSAARHALVPVKQLFPPPALCLRTNAMLLAAQSAITPLHSGAAPIHI